MKIFKTKLIYACSILIATINIANAQSLEYHCDGVVTEPPPTYATSTVSFPCAPSTAPSSSFTTIYQKKENYIPDNTKTEALYVEKVIKIHITVIQEPIGAKKNYGPSDIAFINSIVSTANSYLVNNPAPTDPVVVDGRDPHVYDTRFSIEHVGDITFVNDANLLYENLYTSVPAGLFYKPESVLNVFITYSNTNLSPGGIAKDGPNGATGTDHLLLGINDGTPHIVFKNFYSNALPAENATNYLLHEIGHLMGVHHTYKYDWGAVPPTATSVPETLDETHYDYLEDVFKSGTAKFNYRPESVSTYPAIPYQFYDPSNPSTADDDYTNNFMGGHPYGHYYSPMQIGRMHRNAHFLNIRKYIYNRWPEDENHDGLGQGQIHPLLVSNNQTWDFDIKMYSDIRVETGATLTIKCRVLMPYHSNIIVEPGAKLVVDGGIITADRNYDNYFWYGITVLGDITKSQDLAGAQGIAEIKNNATIEHALHGVVAGDEIHKDNNKCGGILRISDANFINNKNAVGIWKYENKAVWPVGLHKPNRSFIRTSLFELNDNYQYDNTDHPRRMPQAQIIIWDVDGFKIEGCTISNNMSVAKRARIGNRGGMGIYCYEGNFTLANYCPTILSGPCSPATLVPSVVSGFVYGIRGEAVASKPFTAINTTFDKNLFGVITGGVNGQQIRNNTIYPDDPAALGSTPIGVYAYGSNAFTIEGNNIQNLYSLFARGEGVRIEESSKDDNKVNNNHFYRMNIGCNSIGMHTNGTHDPEELNRGLSFFCNSNYLNTGDIYVMGNDENLDGIKSNQGTISRPAGNEFTNYPTSSRLGRHFIMYQTGTSGGPYFDKVRPVDAYYYSTTTGIYQQPTKNTVGRVIPVGIPEPIICILPAEGEISNDKIGAVGSTTSYASMTAALRDTSENRNSLIVAAYQGMHSPYADAELSLYHIREGNISQGLALYGSIATTHNLNSKEQYEFAIGASLVNLMASHYLSGVAMDSLSQANIDTLHYITANAVTWPRAKACAWLYFAADEECGMTQIDPLPEDTTNSGQWRIAQNNAIAQEIGERLSVSPNPSSNYFAINYHIQQDAELQVSDVSGRIVARMSLAASQNTQSIDARQWQTGVYLYKVMQAKKIMYYGKLLKY